MRIATGKKIMLRNLRLEFMEKMKKAKDNQKHNWVKVVDDPNDWNQVRQVIDDVISTGEVKPYLGSSEVFQATKNIKGTEVVVRYHIERGVGTAYVR